MNTIINNTNIRTILISLLLTLSIYLVYGYQLGLEDGPEFLPFAKVFQNPFLYKNDLFVKSMLAMPWNERTIFGLFFSMFDSLEWAGFIVHVILTFFLVLGVFKLSTVILKDVWWSLLFTLIYFFITLQIEIGSTTLYYHNIQGETFANTFIIGAWVAFVHQREKLTFLLIGLATYFHALIGFQCFLFISGAYLIYMLYTKDFEKLKNILYCILGYIITCSWIIVLIFMGNKSEGIGSSKEFMDLTYHFSLKCHFDPLAFSRNGYMLFLISLIAGFYFYKKQQPLLFFAFITLSAGYVIYLIGFYANSYLITSSWWFRTNMWIMLLGQIAIVGLLKNISSINKFRYLLFALVFIALGFKIIWLSEIPKMYPWKNLSLNNDEIKTAYACKKYSNIDDVFIHPLTFSALKYFGERASYVEYNRYVRSKKDIKVWYNRLGEVYKLNTSIETARNPDFNKVTNENYNNLKDSELSILANKGVKYAIFPLDHTSKFPCIYSNNSYKIIQIRNGELSSF